MMRPVILFANPKTNWAKLVRTTLRKSRQIQITSSKTRLKRLLKSYPPGVLVIIDTKQEAAPENLISDIKAIQDDIVILVASSAQTWDETVSYLKSGASNILIKTMNPEQLITALHGW